MPSVTVAAIILPSAHVVSCIRRLALAALASLCRPVIVVSGGNEVRPELAGLPLDIVNTDSVRAGLETALLSTPHLDAAVVMSCDHPRITAASIRRLLSMFQKAHAPIIASAYEHTVGLPALFSRTVFPDLLALPPGEDPKRIIADRAPQVDTVRMPEAATEIDTVADFETLRQ